MGTQNIDTQTVADAIIEQFQLSKVRAEDLFEGQHVLILENNGLRFGELYEDTAHMTGSTHVHLNMNGESLTTRKYAETSRRYNESEYDEPDFIEHNPNALYYGTRF
jgi:hypothetical protein